MWSRLGIDRRDQVLDQLSCRRAAPRARRSRWQQRGEPVDDRRSVPRTRCAADKRRRAWPRSSSTPSKRSRGDQQRHGEADPGDACRSPITAAQPTGGRTRPRLTRVTGPRGRRRPRPACRRRSRRARPSVTGAAYARRQEVAVERDAGVGQGEQRHDHIARPRVVEAPAAARSATASRSSPTRGRCGPARASAPRGTRGPVRSPRSRSERSAGYARVSSPMASPTITGSTPRDSSSATQTAAPSIRSTKPPPMQRSARAAEHEGEQPGGSDDQGGDGSGRSRCRRSRSQPAPAGRRRRRRLEVKARSRSGTRCPKSASSPSANAVSVDIGDAPAVGAEGSPALNARRSRPPPPSRLGRSEQGQGETTALAELAEVELPPGLSPTTRKKKLIRPLLTQWRRSCDGPCRSEPDATARCASSSSYDDASTFAHTSATTTAPTSTPALPDSVCRNDRSGADRPRCHSVMPRHGAEDDESAIAHHGHERTDQRTLPALVAVGN